MGVRALHCAAAAGGSSHSPEVVRILLDASADMNSVDANGNRPSDLIALTCCKSDFNSRKMILDAFSKASGSNSERERLLAQVTTEMEGFEQQANLTPRVWKDGNEKKDYLYDLALPDIKNEIYGTNEFRMYTFKAQPCSRAYFHDWTECPFVHPGENARRHDPRKYLYSCVPCPKFHKGSCKHGDNCEYAHGIFESWLHPAQYRTRLCKDETNCTRKVCFFAHKLEELRPLYTSIGSALPSPTSYSANPDHGSISPFAHASPFVIKPPTSTPPLTPTGTSSIGVGMWSNQSSMIPPTLQLPSNSRMKAARSA
ncbi:Zinc finger CCCH domain-containing protein 66 [Hibiscus syriacus]|uniref:Zinc finger CCCH domain-containing protein 66 n=1 Tax=Hibiscus syriacus TaxID=106335 RepID=A0A6A2XEC5_HIBSY|nr:Zinc finger CCCH domain-containing protein 66 [Hibiscus syriacus]